MQITKFIQFFGLIFIFSIACIDRYYLDSEADFEGKLVIDGTITDQGGIQKITISKSATPEFPKFNPVSGCTVVVQDDLGNSFPFEEKGGRGYYITSIDEGQLVVGRKYNLVVTTPEGDQYQSQLEELKPCPPVDSVYYELETRGTYEHGVDENGLQFYLDFKGNETDGNFYRWKLEETYEYHSSWPITRYLDAEENYQDVGTDYSFFVCYQTEDIERVFTLSTQEFSKNSYKKFPLHFVNDHTQRLLYQYSLLVSQYSISEAAYHYWDSLRKNNQESVDLFGKQPANVQGNIFNVKDSSEVVLGYFGVSSVTSKRIHVLGVPELSYSEVDQCEALPLEAGVQIPSAPRPLYMVMTRGTNGNKVWGFAGTECFICTMKGGTTEKPVYWIDE
tara:strand:- start:2359 stop:3531 length:1173 start_codon:yes stop_codon:yes gene_type:complete